MTDPDPAVNQQTQDAMRSMAFAATGSYQRYDNQAGFNAAVAGLLAPLLSHRVELMAAGMLALNLAGFGLWYYWRRRFSIQEPATALS